MFASYLLRIKSVYPKKVLFVKQGSLVTLLFATIHEKKQVHFFFAGDFYSPPFSMPNTKKYVHLQKRI